MALYLDADIFAEGAFEDSGEVMDERRNIGGFGSEGLLSGKGEQAGGEFSAAQGGFAGLVDHFLVKGVFGHLFEEIEVADHDGE